MKHTILRLSLMMIPLAFMISVTPGLAGAGDDSVNLKVYSTPLHGGRINPMLYGVKYWQVGNEIDAPGYVKSLVEFARAVRAADPGAIVLDFTDFGSDFSIRGGEVVKDAQDRRQIDIINSFANPQRVVKVKLERESGNVVTIPALSVAAIDCGKE